MITLNDAVENLNSTEYWVVRRLCESERYYNQLAEAVHHFDLVEILRLCDSVKHYSVMEGAVMNINPLNIYNYMRFTDSHIIHCANDCENDNEGGCCLPNCCANSLADGKRCKDYNYEMYTTVNL
tara:strand:- start:1314 stop:1688 length:375 start_codon:yes stop_codon:yes gene_type:complete